MTTADVHPLLPIEPGTEIILDGDRLVIERLVVTDHEAVRLVATAPQPDRAGVLERIISVGARGLTTMGIGIDVASIDARVHSVVTSVTDEAEKKITGILENSQRAVQEQFDPQQRTSILARALDDFTEWRDAFLATLDPAIEGSTATQLIGRLQSLVGPDGALEQRLTDALDIDTDGSAFGRLAATMDQGFADLRRDIARTQGADEARAEEAERGTAHGIVFEDVVESHLRVWAGGRPGTIVERTSATAGALGVASKVGDFVVTLPDGQRIVVEAKRHASIALTGADGILSELDRATANRRADAAICIAGRDSFPAEVGSFNVYGDRVLVVDEGDGIMMAVALQWAAGVLAARSTRGVELDGPAVTDRIDRIRKAAESLRGARRTVTSIKGSLGNLHDLLGDMRVDLLEQVDDLDRLLCVTESRGAGDTRS